MVSIYWPSGEMTMVMVSMTLVDIPSTVSGTARRHLDVCALCSLLHYMQYGTHATPALLCIAHREHSVRSHHHHHSILWMWSVGVVIYSGIGWSCLDAKRVVAYSTAWHVGVLSLLAVCTPCPRTTHGLVSSLMEYLVH